MIRLFILLLQIGYVNILLAQSPNIQWQKCYGGSNAEASNQIIQIKPNNFTFLFGTESTNGDIVGNHNGSWDPWLINLDSTGYINWQNCFGGTLLDIFSSHIVLPDGNFLFCGATQSNDGDVTGNHNPGTSDAWLVETDSLGAIIRQKCFGGSGSDEFENLALTNDGRILLVGVTNSTDGDLVGTFNHGGDDLWVIQIDSGWNIIRQRLLGGSDEEVPRGIIVQENGKYLIGGFSSSTNGDISAPLGFSDFWLIQLDSLYNKVFDKSYGGSQRDFFSNFISCDGGGYLMIGTTESNDINVVGNHGDRDSWIIKIDSVGAIEWQKCYGGSYDDEATSLIKDSDEGCFILGYTSSDDGDVVGNHGGCFPSPCPDIWLLKIDSVGSVMWQKCIGGTDGELGADLALTTDSGFVVIGGAFSNDGDVSGGGNHGNNDSWVLKLSSESTNITISYNPIVDFTTYFSPTRDFLFLNFYEYRNERVEVQLFDMAGRLLLSQAIAAVSGFNNHQLNTVDLSKGVYSVRLVSEGGMITKKLIVQ